MAAPPLDAGAAQDRLTDPLPAVAARDCGGVGTVGALDPICAHGCDSSMRPDTNFPLRQWPLSTPPPLSTCPESRYVVVAPEMVILTAGIAPELTHDAVFPPLYAFGGKSEPSKLAEFFWLPVSVSTSMPCALTVRLEGQRL